MLKTIDLVPLVSGCCHNPGGESNPAVENILGVVLLVAVAIAVAGNIWWWRWSRKKRRGDGAPPTHDVH